MYCPLREGDSVLKETGDGERADAAGDGSEERALRRAGRVSVPDHCPARFRRAGVNEHNAVFEHLWLDEVR